MDKKMKSINKIGLISLLFLFLIMGCEQVDVRDCIEAAEIDYEMENPKCVGSLETKWGVDCGCYEQECKTLSCNIDRANKVNFNLK